jgi:hypothetical protein
MCYYVLRQLALHSSIINHNWTSHFKLNCFEMKLWTQETSNLNGKLFLLWWDLNSGPPNLQSSSNLLFSGLLAKLVDRNSYSYPPLAGGAQCGCQFTYKLVYGEVWLNPVFQFPQSHLMGLQCSLLHPVKGPNHSLAWVHNILKTAMQQTKQKLVFYLFFIYRGS